MPTLTAETLKDALWETLQAIKSEEMLPNRGDAIASQAREILRTVKIQMEILKQTKQAIPQGIIDFSGRRTVDTPTARPKLPSGGKSIRKRP